MSVRTGLQILPRAAVIGSASRSNKAREDVMRNATKALRAAAIGAMLAVSGATFAEMPAIAKHGYFFVGGKYHDVPGGKIMAGHIYVEYLIPKTRTDRKSTRLNSSHVSESRM